VQVGCASSLDVMPHPQFLPYLLQVISKGIRITLILSLFAVCGITLCFSLIYDGVCTTEALQDLASESKCSLQTYLLDSSQSGVAVMLPRIFMFSTGVIAGATTILIVLGILLDTVKWVARSKKS
jgi:hypothetical protein